MAEDKKDFPYDAPWAEHLKHRPDPNHVRSLQTPAPGHFEPRRAAPIVPADPSTATPGLKPPACAAQQADPNLAKQPEPAYYDISPLKRPLWKWEIATYFFLGGVSTGAHLIGRAADRFGGESMSQLSRVASYLALLSILPGPPLLIHDLGDPKRFHHMLRVWKPSNPMNVGTWAITAYSGVITADAIRHFIMNRAGDVPADELSKLQKLSKSGTLLLVQDAAGLPLALLVASYTGVLLTTTANPLWCRNPWLSPLFTASAISTGAEALMLALDSTAKGRANRSAHKTLSRIDTIAHLAEFVCMYGFDKFAGEKAMPLKSGKMKGIHNFSIASLVAAEVLKVVPARGKPRTARDVLSSALGLAGGLAMRWAMIYGAHEAADDPHTARLVSAPGDPANGSSPKRSNHLQ